MNAELGKPDGESPAQFRARLDYSDADLLAECDVHTYRASGPGGQHRNKTSSAIRLQHRPTGLVTQGEESRSQHENKARALRRLRETIAINLRCPLPGAPDWPSTVQLPDGKLRVADNNPALPYVLAITLDALAAHDGKLAETAQWLGVTSSSLTRFLSGHHAAWAEANRIRAAAGLSPLRS